MKIINIQASKIFGIPKQLHVNIIEKHIQNRHSRQSQVKLHLYSYKGIMKKKTYYKYSIKDSKNKIHFLSIFPSKLRQTHCIPTFFCIQYKRHHLKFTFAFSLSIYMYGILSNLMSIFSSRAFINCPQRIKSKVTAWIIYEDQ